MEARGTAREEHVEPKPRIEEDERPENSSEVVEMVEASDSWPLVEVFALLKSMVVVVEPYRVWRCAVSRG